ncbi:helix-turn-helix domain-containing protein [Listeria monocytogenes]|nr:helix-turn-helix domain-containing protein [Listeria monocytogenes]EAC8263470.1 helix-turn-helix domain-containing protein [Listeria monocytogenes]EAD0410470.1 helix-turn-helix domain-containing protein [Listeria monocytogenes]EAD0419176.1 helix-turn-helix domain-containing protein [Listeria monocytogenes]
MISYGELIRQIRQSKKISQKEVYTGVISKSYAIEFEKGTHAISSLLLEKIVAKLMVSMEEFFLMYHQEELPEKEDFWEAYERTCKTNEANAWESLYQKISLEKGKVNQVKSAAIKLELDHIKGKQVVDKKAVQILENYLIEAVFWTLQDIFLFTRMMHYLPLKSRVPFYYKLLNTLDRYRHFERGRSILQSALASIMDDFIERNEIEHMELMIKSIEKISEDCDGTYSKILCMYYRGIVRWGEGEEREGGEEIDQAVAILRALSYENKAAEYETMYRQFARENNDIKTME